MLRRLLLMLVVGTVATFALGGIAQANTCTVTNTFSSGPNSMPSYGITGGLGQWKAHQFSVSCSRTFTSVEYIAQLNIAGYDKSTYYANTNGGAFQSISTGGPVTFLTDGFKQFTPGCNGKAWNGAWVGAFNWTTRYFLRMHFASGSPAYEDDWGPDSQPVYGATCGTW